jgi:1-acyl-sn-glycerol-3-phosphate acyltransferase
MFYNLVAFPIAKVILAVGTFLLGPITIRGRANVPNKGGLLIVANHLSDADPAVLGHALRRKAFYMAKSELFEIPVLGWVIKTLRAFPVSRGAPDRAAIRRTVDLLRAGEAVAIFPEGQLSETGELQPLMPGVAMIILRSEVPVICAGLVGTTKIIPFKKVVPRPAFGGVSVNFGIPKQFNHSTSHGDVLNWISNELTRLTNNALDSPSSSGVK